MRDAATAARGPRGTVRVDGTVPVTVELAAVTSPRRARVVADAAARARDAGFGVALGDIGAGERVVEMLLAVAPDVVIVNGSAATDTGALVAVADAAGDAGAIVVAVGVDSERDVERLQDAGIAFGAGLRFGRPDLVVRPPVVHDRDGLGVRHAPADARGVSASSD
jgi:EAL domain-containing protein (putative c-di-GMP-specific phosphodiesterase class I)